MSKRVILKKILGVSLVSVIASLFLLKKTHERCKMFKTKKRESCVLSDGCQYENEKHLCKKQIPGCGMPHEIKDNYAFYSKNKKALMGKHSGKYILIYGQKVVAYFDDFDQTYAFAEKNGYSAGTFLIQDCTNKPVIFSRIGAAR